MVSAFCPLPCSLSDWPFQAWGDGKKKEEKLVALVSVQLHPGLPDFNGPTVSLCGSPIGSLQLCQRNKGADGPQAQSRLKP